MNITLLAIGTRGDTQPYIAIGLALQAAGHAVRLCAADNFRSLVEGYGLTFAPLGVDIENFLQTRMPAGVEGGANLFETIQTLVRESLAYADVMWERIQAACAGADLIAVNFLGIGASCLAEKQGIPFILMHSTPLLGRTRTAPPMALSAMGDLGAWPNLLLHWIVETAFKLTIGAPGNLWRESLGLDHLPRLGWDFDQLPNMTIPMLYGHSAYVLPRPDDWREHWYVTGYWFLDAAPDWQPPADLIAFLDDGPPPVYVGFGSMPGRDPAALTRLVLDALKKAEQRAILATGWGALAEIDVPDTVFVVSSVPHDWLFPRMAAVVHHGGAGTTAAGYRAGVPTAIVPHFGDQSFWGRCTERLGVGVQTVLRRSLTPDDLARALRRVTSDGVMQQRAILLGDRIRGEDGIGTAIQLIEKYAHSLPSR